MVCLIFVHTYLYVCVIKIIKERERFSFESFGLFESLVERDIEETGGRKKWKGEWCNYVLFKMY